MRLRFPSRTIERRGYLIVFVEHALGVDAIREVCRPFAADTTSAPLIAILGAESLTSAEVDELIAAGASVQIGGDVHALAPRVRFLKHSLAKRSETITAVRESEERHRTVIAALDEGLIVQDAHGAVTAMNPRAGQILGLTDEGIRARLWRDGGWNLLREDGSAGGPQDLPGMKALTLGRTVRGSVLGRRKSDGLVTWISANSHLVRDAKGERAVGVVTTFSDITDRRRAEDEFRELLEHTPDAVFIYRNASCLWASQTFAELLGYEDPSAFVGASVLLFVDPSSHPLVTERLQTRGENPGTLSALELALRRRDGSVVHVAVTGGPTMYEGTPASICFARDRTAQRRLETELAAKEHLAALGRLAAGVGHEINNPLAYVMGNLTLATERLRNGEGAAAALTLLDEALEGAGRVRTIVRDLNVFAARKADELVAVDVLRVIDSCTRMADVEIRQRARLVRVFGDVPAVRANEARLAQVLVNLLLNAAHAIPEGHAGEEAITVTTRREPDGRVAIEVSDTGSGIAPEHLPHVFEPFFTTKGERGTGLGLSICHALVAAQGGELTIESTYGRGTCLTIRLLAAGASESRPDERESPRPSAKRRRILVVDDEVRIARWICDALAEEEHDVSFVSSGVEALERIKEGDPFDAIVCDLMMPTLSGMDVHARIQLLRPGLQRRMVFMTGGAFTPRAIQFLAENKNPRVEKPFELSELTRAIEDLEGT